MREPTHVMLHHSSTEDSDTVSWAAIHKYHVETQGWRDIGYHAGVELVTSNPNLAAYRYEALFGRGLEEQASACPQGEMNRRALHVCCIGNYDLIPPPSELLAVLSHRILLPWMRLFNIPPERIVGHRDYNPDKTCPGRQFDIDVVRRLVR